MLFGVLFILYIPRHTGTVRFSYIYIYLLYFNNTAIYLQKLKLISLYAYIHYTIYMHVRWSRVYCSFPGGTVINTVYPPFLSSSAIISSTSLSVGFCFRVCRTVFSSAASMNPLLSLSNKLKADLISKTTANNFYLIFYWGVALVLLSFAKLWFV